jgi:AcrR family transcriptional regulator
MSTTNRRRGAPRRNEPSARSRLIETAAELFYQEGIRAVGIDAVIAHSGVSKSSLYRTFASKDELIAAFAESENQRFWRWWDETEERYADASRQLRALLEGIGEQIESPRFRGCPFINLANEFPDRQHPGTAIACGNKREMRERLRSIARALGARTPQRLGDQLALLIDGAYGRAVTLGPDGLKRELIDTAAVLIDAQIR